MKYTITLEIESNEELLSLFDSSVEYIFVDQFNPNENLKWWKSSLKTENGLNLNDVSVRSMKFDLHIPFSELRRLLDLNTRQLRIYQFDKPVPDTLEVGHLHQLSKNEILQLNGLKHFFWVDFEFVTVSSFDEDFIEGIKKKFET